MSVTLAKPSDLANFLKSKRTLTQGDVDRIEGERDKRRGKLVPHESHGFYGTAEH